MHLLHLEYASDIHEFQVQSHAQCRWLYSSLSLTITVVIRLVLGLACYGSHCNIGWIALSAGWIASRLSLLDSHTRSLLQHLPALHWCLHSLTVRYWFAITTTHCAYHYHCRKLLSAPHSGSQLGQTLCPLLALPITSMCSGELVRDGAEVALEREADALTEQCRSLELCFDRAELQKRRLSAMREELITDIAGKEEALAIDRLCLGMEPHNPQRVMNTSGTETQVPVSIVGGHAPVTTPCDFHSKEALAVLRELGFENELMCKRVLLLADGDVKAAVRELMAMEQQSMAQQQTPESMAPHDGFARPPASQTRPHPQRMDPSGTWAQVESRNAQYRQSGGHEASGWCVSCAYVGRLCERGVLSRQLETGWDANWDVATVCAYQISTKSVVC